MLCQCIICVVCVCIKTSTLPHADIIITLDHLVINSESEIGAGRRIGGEQLGGKRWGNSTNLHRDSFIRESQSLVKLSRRGVRLFAESDTCCRVVLFIIESFRTSGLVAWDTTLRRGLLNGLLYERPATLILSPHFYTLDYSGALPFTATLSLRRIIKVNRSALSLSVSIPQSTPLTRWSRRFSCPGPAVSHGNSLANCLNYKLKQQKEIKKKSVNDYSSTHTHTQAHNIVCSYNGRWGVNGHKKSR